MNITIATGFDHDKIIKIVDIYPRVTTLYNEEYLSTNFGKSLEMYLDINPDIDNIFIINSGILFRPSTFSVQQLKNTSKLFILDKAKNNFDIGCNNNQNIEYLFYDLPNAWSECVFVNRDAICSLLQIMTKKPIAQMYIFEIINQIIARGTRFEKHTVSKKNFLKISTIKDINRAKIFV